jgi:uncharacterized protein involved in exopolysaccharide biosynthesis
MMLTEHDSGDLREPPPLREFLAHLHARRRGAAYILAAILIPALVVAALLTPQYRATASLAVMPSPEYTVREDAGSRAFNNSALAMDQIMKAETGILESDDLHEHTIVTFSEPGATTPHRASPSGALALYPDLGPDRRASPISAALNTAVAFILSPWRGRAPAGSNMTLDAAVKRFGDHLRVLPSKDSNVISVSFVHDDAGISARILNDMLTRYSEQRRRIYNDPQLAVAQGEADDAAMLVRNADAALTAFKAKRGYSDYAAERDLLLKRRSQAQQSLADADAARMQSHARLAVIDGEIRQLPLNTTLYRESDTDTRLQTLDDRLVDLTGRLASAREHYRDTSRNVVDLQTQISLREAERRRMGQDSTPSVVRFGRNLATDTLVVDKVHAAADLASAIAQSVAIHAEISSLNGALETLAADETGLADMTRRKEAADASFAAASRAAAEQRLTEAEDARRLANVRIIQPARVPQHPTWTKPLVCIAGALIALLCALCWLIGGFVTSDTLLTEAGLAYATGLPVLGVFRGMQDRMHPANAPRADA